MAAVEKRGAKGRRRDEVLIDRELEDLSPAARWREWMLRAEAVIFASAEPVDRETLSRVVGQSCAIDLLIDDLREDLRGRPYDIIAVAGGWQHRTRPAYASAVRASRASVRSLSAALSEHEAAVLMAIAYVQPVTRGELSKMFGREISRDTIAGLRAAGFIASGPRSPTPGAPYSYVTTRHFLAAFGFQTLRDLPNLEALEDAGLLSMRARPDLEDEDAGAGQDDDTGNEG